MKNLSLKKLLAVVGIITIATLGMNANTYAFDKGNKRGGKNYQTKIFKQLNLSDQQKEQIKFIRESKKPELQSLRENSKNLRQQMQSLDPASSSYVSQVQSISAQQANIAQQRASLKAQIRHETTLVLTAEQQAKAKELKAEHKAKRKQRRENRQERKREGRTL